MQLYNIMFVILLLLQSISYSQELSIVEQLRSQWSNYSNLPNQKNATEFDRFLTKLHRSKKIDNLKLNSFLNDFYDKYDMLERQMVSRDSLAITIAYKMYPLTDGHLAEMICISLGKLIRIDPKMFLEQVLANQKYVEDLSGILGNYGSVYVDKIEAQDYEKSLRIKSLESVQDSSLINIRDKCLVIINK